MVINGDLMVINGEFNITTSMVNDDSIFNGDYSI